MSTFLRDGSNDILNCEVLKMRNNFEIRGQVTVIYLERKDGTLQETLVDTDSLGKLIKFKGKWHYAKSTDNHIYVTSTIYIQGKAKTIRLHRFLLDAPPELYVDHINHNGLDNRLSNLRLVTNSENQQNRRETTGICFVKSRNRWITRIRGKGKLLYQRYFKTEKEAYEALILARTEHLPFSSEAWAYEN